MHYIRQKESNVDAAPHYVRYFDIDYFFTLGEKGNKIKGNTLYIVAIMVYCKWLPVKFYIHRLTHGNISLNMWLSRKRWGFMDLVKYFVTLGDGITLSFKRTILNNVPLL